MVLVCNVVLYLIHINSMLILKNKIFSFYHLIHYIKIFFISFFINKKNKKCTLMKLIIRHDEDLKKKKSKLRNS